MQKFLHFRKVHARTYKKHIYNFFISPIDQKLFAIEEKIVGGTHQCVDNTRRQSKFRLEWENLTDFFGVEFWRAKRATLEFGVRFLVSKVSHTRVW